MLVGTELELPGAGRSKWDMDCGADWDGEEV